MGLLEGKRALIFGLANDHSIAWGIAKACAREGARLVRGDTEHCLRAAFEHMGIAPAPGDDPARVTRPREAPELLDVAPEDLPF